MMVKHALKVLKHVTPLVPIFAQMEVTLWTYLIGFIVSRWILFFFFGILLSFNIDLGKI